MHCRRVNAWDRLQALESDASLTEFSEKNTLRPAPSATSRTDISEALRTLRVFGGHFYGSGDIELVDSAISFIDQYAGVPEHDKTGWKMLAFWVTSKFSKYRSLLVAHDTDAAAGVRLEFSRNDEELLELRDLRELQRPSDASVPTSA